jgi:hypothetical protein
MRVEVVILLVSLQEDSALQVQNTVRKKRLGHRFKNDT